MSIHDKIRANVIRFNWKNTPDGKAKKAMLQWADKLSGRL